MATVQPRGAKRAPTVRTASEAREWLRMNGMSISQFARDNGLSRDSVQDLLQGRSNGTIGESHRAAVALGMKVNPDFPAKSRKPTRTGRR